MIYEEKSLNPTYDGKPGSSAKSVLEALDESALSGFHLKAMITAGMGFFTDAYDLFIIGAVLAILAPLWHLNALEISLLGSTSLIAAALGSLIFGWIADHIGRKFIYGYELVVLAIGAIASALSPNVFFLLAFRFIMGLGIGGDYPVSATLMSEYSNRKDRGKLITMVFSMQGVGLIIGPLIAIALLKAGLNSDWTWRIMLAVGAIPAIGTFYLRRRVSETPRYALAMQGDIAGASQTLHKVTKGQHKLAATSVQQPGKTQQRAKTNWSRLLLRAPYLRWIIGTAGAWFLLDVAYYGTTISSPLVLKTLNSHASQITNLWYTLAIFVVAAFPGYILAAFMIDKLGRKLIQCLGFAMMALAYALIAFVPSISAITVPFLLVYGMSYFFTEFGPNVTTFVYPAEIFPVMVRTTGHGISASLGKIGAFIGAFIFPYLLTSYHLPGAMGFAAVISLAGFILSLVTLPEPNQRSLEDISNEHSVREAHEAQTSELATVK